MRGVGVPTNWMGIVNLLECFAIVPVADWFVVPATTSPCQCPPLI